MMLASMSRGCYAEKGPVEFKLNNTLMRCSAYMRYVSFYMFGKRRVTARKQIPPTSKSPAPSVEDWLCNRFSAKCHHGDELSNL